MPGEADEIKWKVDQLWAEIDRQFHAQPSRNSHHRRWLFAALCFDTQSFPTVYDWVVDEKRQVALPKLQEEEKRLRAIPNSWKSQLAADICRDLRESQLPEESYVHVIRYAHAIWHPDKDDGLALFCDEARSFVLDNHWDEQQAKRYHPSQYAQLGKFPKGAPVAFECLRTVTDKKEVEFVQSICFHITAEVERMQPRAPQHRVNALDVRSQQIPEMLTWIALHDDYAWRNEQLERLRQTFADADATAALQARVDTALHEQHLSAKETLEGYLRRHPIRAAFDVTQQLELAQFHARLAKSNTPLLFLPSAWYQGSTNILDVLQNGLHHLLERSTEQLPISFWSTRHADQLESTLERLVSTQSGYDYAAHDRAFMLYTQLSSFYERWTKHSEAEFAKVFNTRDQQSPQMQTAQSLAFHKIETRGVEPILKACHFALALEDADSGIQIWQCSHETPVALSEPLQTFQHWSYLSELWPRAGMMNRGRTLTIKGVPRIEDQTLEFDMAVDEKNKPLAFLIEKYEPLTFAQLANEMARFNTDEKEEEEQDQDMKDASSHTLFKSVSAATAKTVPQHAVRRPPILIRHDLAGHKAESKYKGKRGRDEASPLKILANKEMVKRLRQLAASQMIQQETGSAVTDLIREHASMRQFNRSAQRAQGLLLLERKRRACLQNWVSLLQEEELDNDTIQFAYSLRKAFYANYGRKHTLDIDVATTSSKWIDSIKECGFTYNEQHRRMSANWTNLHVFSLMQSLVLSVSNLLPRVDSTADLAAEPKAPRDQMDVGARIAPTTHRYIPNPFSTRALDIQNEPVILEFLAALDQPDRKAKAPAVIARLKEKGEALFGAGNWDWAKFTFAADQIYPSSFKPASYAEQFLLKLRGYQFDMPGTSSADKSLGIVTNMLKATITDTYRKQLEEAKLGERALDNKFAVVGEPTPYDQIFKIGWMALYDAIQTVQEQQPSIGHLQLPKRSDLKVFVKSIMAQINSDVTTWVNEPTTDANKIKRAQQLNYIRRTLDWFTDRYIRPPQGRARFDSWNGLLSLYILAIVAQNDMVTMMAMIRDRYYPIQHTKPKKKDEKEPEIVAIYRPIDELVIATAVKLYLSDSAQGLHVVSLDVDKEFFIDQKNAGQPKTGLAPVALADLGNGVYVKLSLLKEDPQEKAIAELLHKYEKDIPDVARFEQLVRHMATYLNPIPRPQETQSELEKNVAGRLLVIQKYLQHLKAEGAPKRSPLEDYLAWVWTVWDSWFSTDKTNVTSRMGIANSLLTIGSIPEGVDIKAFNPYSAGTVDQRNECKKKLVAYAEEYVRFVNEERKDEMKTYWTRCADRLMTFVSPDLLNFILNSKSPQATRALDWSQYVGSFYLWCRKDSKNMRYWIQFVGAMYPFSYSATNGLLPFMSISKADPTFDELTANADVYSFSKTPEFAQFATTQWQRVVAPVIAQRHGSPGPDPPKRGSQLSQAEATVIAALELSLKHHSDPQLLTKWKSLLQKRLNGDESSTLFGIRFVNALVSHALQTYPPDDRENDEKKHAAAEAKDKREQLLGLDFFPPTAPHQVSILDMVIHYRFEHNGESCFLHYGYARALRLLRADLSEHWIAFVATLFLRTPDLLARVDFDKPATGAYNVLQQYWTSIQKEGPEWLNRIHRQVSGGWWQFFKSSSPEQVTRLRDLKSHMQEALAITQAEGNYFPGLAMSSSPLNFDSRLRLQLLSASRSLRTDDPKAAPFVTTAATWTPQLMALFYRTRELFFNANAPVPVLVKPGESKEEAAHELRKQELKNLTLSLKRTQESIRTTAENLTQRLMNPAENQPSELKDTLLIALIRTYHANTAANTFAVLMEQLQKAVAAYKPAPVVGEQKMRAFGATPTGEAEYLQLEMKLQRLANSSGSQVVVAGLPFAHVNDLVDTAGMAREVQNVLTEFETKNVESRSEILEIKQWQTTILRLQATLGTISGTLVSGADRAFEFNLSTLMRQILQNLQFVTRLIAQRDSVDSRINKWIAQANERDTAKRVRIGVLKTLALLRHNFTTGKRATDVDLDAYPPDQEIPGLLGNFAPVNMRAWEQYMSKANYQRFMTPEYHPNKNAQLVEEYKQLQNWLEKRGTLFKFLDGIFNKFTAMVTSLGTLTSSKIGVWRASLKNVTHFLNTKIASAPSDTLHNAVAFLVAADFLNARLVLLAANLQEAFSSDFFTEFERLLDQVTDLPDVPDRKLVSDLQKELNETDIKFQKHLDKMQQLLNPDSAEIDYDWEEIFQERLAAWQQEMSVVRVRADAEKELLRRQLIQLNMMFDHAYNMRTLVLASGAGISQVAEQTQTWTRKITSTFFNTQLLLGAVALAEFVPPVLLKVYQEKINLDWALSMAKIFPGGSVFEYALAPVTLAVATGKVLYGTATDIYDQMKGAVRTPPAAPKLKETVDKFAAKINLPTVSEIYPNIQPQVAALCRSKLQNLAVLDPRFVASGDWDQLKVHLSFTEQDESWFTQIMANAGAAWTKPRSPESFWEKQLRVTRNMFAFLLPKPESTNPLDEQRQQAKDAFLEALRDVFQPQSQTTNELKAFIDELQKMQQGSVTPNMTLGILELPEEKRIELFGPDWNHQANRIYAGLGTAGMAGAQFALLSSSWLANSRPLRWISSCQPLSIALAALLLHYADEIDAIHSSSPDMVFQQMLFKCVLPPSLALLAGHFLTVKKIVAVYSWLQSLRTKTKKAKLNRLFDESKDVEMAKETDAESKEQKEEKAPRSSEETSWGNVKRGALKALTNIKRGAFNTVKYGYRTIPLQYLSMVLMQRFAMPLPANYNQMTEYTSNWLSSISRKASPSELNPILDLFEKNWFGSGIGVYFPMTTMSWTRYLRETMQKVAKYMTDFSGNPSVVNQALYGPCSIQRKVAIVAGHFGFKNTDLTSSRIGQWLGISTEEIADLFPPVRDRATGLVRFDEAPMRPDHHLGELLSADNLAVVSGQAVMQTEDKTLFVAIPSTLGMSTAATFDAIQDRIKRDKITKTYICTEEQKYNSMERTRQEIRDFYEAHLRARSMPLSEADPNKLKILSCTQLQHAHNNPTDKSAQADDVVRDVIHFFGKKIEQLKRLTLFLDKVQIMMQHVYNGVPVTQALLDNEPPASKPLQDGNQWHWGLRTYSEAQKQLVIRNGIMVMMQKLGGTDDESIRYQKQVMKFAHGDDDHKRWLSVLQKGVTTSAVVGGAISYKFGADFGISVFLTGIVFTEHWMLNLSKDRQGIRWLADAFADAISAWGAQSGLQFVNESAFAQVLPVPGLSAVVETFRQLFINWANPPFKILERRTDTPLSETAELALWRTELEQAEVRRVQKAIQLRQVPSDLALTTAAVLSPATVLSTIASYAPERLAPLIDKLREFAENRTFPWSQFVSFGVVGIQLTQLGFLSKQWYFTEDPQQAAALKQELKVLSFSILHSFVLFVSTFLVASPLAASAVTLVSGLLFRSLRPSPFTQRNNEILDSEQTKRQNIAQAASLYESIMEAVSPSPTSLILVRKLMGSLSERSFRQYKSEQVRLAIPTGARIHLEDQLLKTASQESFVIDSEKTRLQHKEFRKHLHLSDDPVEALYQADIIEWWLASRKLYICNAAEQTRTLGIIPRFLPPGEDSFDKLVAFVSPITSDS